MNYFKKAEQRLRQRNGSAPPKAEQPAILRDYFENVRGNTGAYAQLMPAYVDHLEAASKAHGEPVHPEEIYALRRMLEPKP